MPDHPGAAPIAAKARARICVTEDEFPLSPLDDPRTALAVITGAEGPSYRRIGAAMVVHADGRSWGALSSGCLERDVALHAQAAIETGDMRRLRYGRGSPFADIVLPCGGALEVTVLPRPDRVMLRAAAASLAARQAATIAVAGMALTLIPRARILAFGAGPEAGIFAALARAAGYPVLLHSPDAATLATAGFGQTLTSPGWPANVAVDPFTAIALFFHDHDRELPLLRAALSSPAFYIGAQGSLRAHRARSAALLADGVPAEEVASLASPFGLIASTRDNWTLAISVLADIAAQAPPQGTGRRIATR